MKKIADLILLKSLGKGNFSEVFLTQKENTNLMYATKIMVRSVYDKPPLWNRLINEVQILKMVNHPNIMKFVELKKSQKNWYLVTEYVNGGSLLSNLKKYMQMYHRAFPEDIVQHLMRQILSALSYLHLNKIIHRDLKLDNILVSYPTEYDKQSLNLKKCQVKLIDFGFATKLNGTLAYTALGTPFNMDPVILEQISTGKPNGGYNEKVDIWSLGTLCYQMVVGHSPFNGASMKDLFQRVKKGDYILPNTLSEEIVLFINDMLQQKQEKRATADQLLNSNFILNPVTTFHPVNVGNIQASYLPGGMINMKSNQPEVKNDRIILWDIFGLPELYNGKVTTQNQAQPQIQIQPQPKMQLQNQPAQYIYQQPQQNAYYTKPQINYEYVNYPYYKI